MTFHELSEDHPLTFGENRKFAELGIPRPLDGLRQMQDKG